MENKKNAPINIHIYLKDLSPFWFHILDDDDDDDDDQVQV
jgi:hypothetical protein